mmetsp:Transcript_32631/g.80430  ORF Transcript_32631/g.80430 Transcript_32631/m.80430 type:complete len:215 (-) Transcript_32631:354-998(-)
MTVLVRKIPPSVLFLRPKHSRTRPSHSLKLTGTPGCRGSMRTTLLSTLGGGRKLFLPTLSRCVVRASSCVFTDRRQYSGSPAGTHSRMANSRWNMSVAARNMGRCARSLKMSGEEIWYGTLAMHTSKYGSSTFRKSPEMMLRLAACGVPCTRRCSSSTMRGSNSTAITFLAVSSSRIVRFPVPGPISSTTSVDLTPPFSTMEFTIIGFFRMCCP